MPLRSSFSGSTVTSTWLSTSPATSTLNTPSTELIAGSIDDSSICCSSSMLRSPTMLNWSTGNESGLIRLTLGVSTVAGSRTLFRFDVMVLSASSMSVPYLKLASIIERFSDDIDWIVSSPSTPEIVPSIGAVTSRTTASGLAEG